MSKQIHSKDNDSKSTSTRPSQNMLSLKRVLALSTLFSTLVSASPIAAPEVEAACADVTVFFARGTTEVATLGTIVGPPFKAALGTALAGKSVDFIGVDYPADVAGYLAGGSPIGAANMADGVTQAASRCPDTKIVISGYRFERAPP